MTYQLTINDITCVMPSSSVSNNLDESAAKAERLIDDITGLGVGVIAICQPEMMPAAIVGGGVVVAITDLVAAEADNVLGGLDDFLRDEGFLPDDFYITKETDPHDPQQGGDHEDDVLYPDAGKNPRTHNKNLAKGDMLQPNLTVSLEEGEGLVFWDHDNVGSDDPLLCLPALDDFLGDHDGTYTNMHQECAYAVRWNLTKT